MRMPDPLSPEPFVTPVIYKLEGMSSKAPERNRPRQWEMMRDPRGKDARLYCRGPGCWHQGSRASNKETKVAHYRFQLRLGLKLRHRRSYLRRQRQSLSSSHAHA
jgi:hypothetical protein